MKDYPIKSSFILSVGWSNENLVVRFKNKSVYQYHLPRGYFEAMIDADRIGRGKKPKYGREEYNSPGKFFHDVIKFFPSIKVS